MSSRNPSRPGYKYTSIGFLPKDWELIKAGKVFGNSRDKGTPGLPMMSVTMNSGLVRRDELDRKMQPDLDSDENLLIKSGNICYNMMRAWQGAIALSRFDGMVSPAYVVLKPAREVHPEYYLYLFKGDHYQYLITSYSYGITGDRLRLYYKDFSSLPIPLPPLAEQKKIASILSTWDKAIEDSKKLISAKQTFKKAVAEKLLTGRMRFSELGKPTKKGELPDGWRVVRLGNVAEVKMGTSPSSEAYNLESKGLPLIQGNADIKNRRICANRWTTDITTECFPGDLIMTVRAPVGEIAEADLHGCVGRGACVITNITENRNFLFQFMIYQEDHWVSVSQGSTFESVNSNSIKKINLALPPILEQTQISNFLTKLDNQITILEKWQSFLEQQKKGLMQKLLTGEVRVKLG